MIALFKRYLKFISSCSFHLDNLARAKTVLEKESFDLIESEKSESMMNTNKIRDIKSFIEMPITTLKRRPNNYEKKGLYEIKKQSMKGERSETTVKGHILPIAHLCTPLEMGMRFMINSKGEC